MYRYISLLLAVILAASLISCSDSNKNTGITDTTNGKEETTVSTNDVTTTPEDTTDTDSGTDTSTNDTTTTPDLRRPRDRERYCPSEYTCSRLLQRSE